MNAPTLFDDPNPAPMVRSTDGPTSRLAAQRVDVSGGQAKVLAALRRLGASTDEQITAAEECAGMGRGSAIKRRLELERAGLVVRCGVTGPPRRMLVFRAVGE